MALNAFTLVHESIHIRGMRDEGATDCRAYRELGGRLLRHFGIKNLHRQAMVRYVGLWRRLKPPEYSAAC